MKKIILTLFLLLIFLLPKAQVAGFLSLQSAQSEKDADGNFVQIKEWLGQEIRITFDLSQKKIQFFSKGMLDRDPYGLIQQILLLEESTSPDMGKDKMIRVFSGMDQSGRKCIIRWKVMNNEYNIQEGELRVEYVDRAEIYKITTSRNSQLPNKT